jgi:hypothetical protein
VVGPVVHHDITLAMPQNYPGAIDDVTQSMALVAVFVMGTPVLFALLRVFDRREAG